MEYDFDRFDIGCEDDEFTDTSVKGFGCFVGTGCQPGFEPRSSESGMREGVRAAERRVGYAEPHSGEIKDVERDREVEQVYSNRRAVKVYQAKSSHAPRRTESGPYVKDERSPE